MSIDGLQVIGSLSADGCSPGNVIAAVRGQCRADRKPSDLRCVEVFLKEGVRAERAMRGDADIAGALHGKLFEATAALSCFPGELSLKARVRLHTLQNRLRGGHAPVAGIAIVELFKTLGWVVSKLAHNVERSSQFRSFALHAELAKSLSGDRAVSGKISEIVHGMRQVVRTLPHDEATRQLDKLMIRFNGVVDSFLLDADPLTPQRTQQLFAELVEINDKLLRIQGLPTQAAALREKRVQGLEAEVQALQALAGAHGRDLAGHQVQLQQHQADLAGHQVQLQQHQAGLAGHQVQLQQHQAGLARLDPQVQQHGRDLAGHQVQLQQHQAGLARLDPQVQQHDRDLAGHGQRLNAADRQFTEHGRRFMEHAGRLDQHRDALAAHDRRLAAVDGQIQQLENVFGRMGHDIAAIQERMKQLASREDLVQLATAQDKKFAQAMGGLHQQLEQARQDQRALGDLLRRQGQLLWQHGGRIEQLYQNQARFAEVARQLNDRLTNVERLLLASRAQLEQLAQQHGTDVSALRGAIEHLAEAVQNQQRVLGELSACCTARNVQNLPIEQQFFLLLRELRDQSRRPALESGDGRGSGPCLVGQLHRIVLESLRSPSNRERLAQFIQVRIPGLDEFGAAFLERNFGVNFATGCAFIDQVAIDRLLQERSPLTLEAGAGCLLQLADRGVPDADDLPWDQQDDAPILARAVGIHDAPTNVVADELSIEDCDGDDWTSACGSATSYQPVAEEDGGHAASSGTVSGLRSKKTQKRPAVVDHGYEIPSDEDSDAEEPRHKERSPRERPSLVLDDGDGVHDRRVVAHTKARSKSHAYDAWGGPHRGGVAAARKKSRRSRTQRGDQARRDLEDLHGEFSDS